MGGEWKPSIPFLYKQEGFIFQGPALSHLFLSLLLSSPWKRAEHRPREARGRPSNAGFIGAGADVPEAGLCRHRDGSGFPLAVLPAGPSPAAGPPGQLCLQGMGDMCHGAAVAQAWLEELGLNQWKVISDFHPVPFPTNNS